MSNVFSKIEHHAMIFAIISKNTIIELNEKGKSAILKAVTSYGNERGVRMANTAQAHGDSNNIMAYLAYGEWIPDYPDQMTFGRLSTIPTLKTYISKCAWCEAWQKYGVMEYGKYYCVDVDNAIFKGFNDKFTCTSVTPSMSFGSKQCEFDWGVPLLAEEDIELENRKKIIGTSCARDFNFHTAHLIFSLQRSLVKELGDVGEEIIEKSLTEFAGLFGQAYLDAIQPFMKEF